MTDLTLTPAAAARIKALMDTDNALALRVEVQGGGCSGFQYAFSLTKEAEADDLRVEHGPAVVLIDPVSREMIKGSTLDYRDELGGAYFSITNPNAASRCGCGNSFTL